MSGLANASGAMPACASCPSCASLAPRMRAGANEWIGNSMRRAIGKRLARTRTGAVAVTLVAFVAGFAAEKAVKRICEGSQHVHGHNPNRIASWRRAIVTR